MQEVMTRAEQVPPEDRVAQMRVLLGNMASNDMTDVEQLGRFIDLYEAHDVDPADVLEFYASLDVPEHNIIFGDTTFDTIVETYDALGGLPRNQVPFGLSAVPSDLEKSLGTAYRAVTAASALFQPVEREAAEPEILSERREFGDFASQMGYSATLAGRTWRMLTRRFISRVQPERFDGYTWYDRQDYADFPADLFASYPTLAVDISYEDYGRNVITGLRLQVLEDTLERVEPDGAWTPHEIFGEGTGPKMLTFLRQFVQYKH